MIQVENLTKNYGSYQALKGISFTVKKGEILGFLGPNGAGKTTTMRILTGFFPATSGKAVVAGFDVFEEPMEVRRRIGYLPESVPLYRDMVVADYLRFTAGIKGVKKYDIDGVVKKVMDDCALHDVSHKFIGELSKGYRQRVGLAQSLVNDPDVLILDEPTIGLDPKQIIEIRKLIKGLAGRRTIILSTHILPEVSMTCQRVIIINKGEVVAVDTPQNLTSRIQGGNKLILKIDGDSKSVLDELNGIKGVVRVGKKEALTSTLNEYLVEMEDGVDVRKEFAPRIVKNNWGLFEMRPFEMSLEDIFIKLVTKE